MNLLEYEPKTGEIANLPCSAESVEINGNDYLISSVLDIAERGRMEAELRTSERRFHNIIDAAKEYVYETDAHGIITFISERVKDILGYDPAELIGKNALSVIASPEEVVHARNIYRNLALQKLSIRNMDHHCLTKDGRKRILLVTAFPFFNTEGEIIGYQGMVGDITEHRLAEEALLASEEKYRLLFNEMQEGFALHEIICDEKGAPADYRFLMVNPAFEKLTGLKTEAVIGKTVKQVMPEIETYWVETYGNVALTGKPAAFENYSRANRKYYQVSAFSPQQGRFAVLFNDITKRKDIEESLRKSEFRFSNLFNNMFEGVAHCQMIFENDKPQDFIYLAVNRSFEILTGLKNVKGKKVSEVIPGFRETDRDLLDIYGRVALTGITERFEYYLASLRIWLSISVYGAGENCFIELFHNITERKQAEKNQKLINNVLEIINSAGEIKGIIHRIVALIKEHTGIEAIGLRLKAGKDYPYYETDGFPDYFIQAEKHLCSCGENNEIICEATDNPYLKCICGNIICGRTDTSYSCFTKGGSFWSNDLSKPWVSISENVHQACAKNRCNGEGYESIALIPLRSDNEIIGLLQLNDRRKDCFTLDMIEFFEGIGATIGIALKRLQTEEKLQKEEERYRTVADFTYDWEYWISDDGSYHYVSPSFKQTTGYDVDELIKNPGLLETLIHPADREMVVNHTHDPNKQACPLDFRIITKTGEEQWIGHICQQVYDAEGNSLGWRGSNRNVTEQKKIEAQLRQSQKMEALGTLAGGIAHDFNNILGAIMGYAGMAQEELPAGSIIKEYIAEVYSASERAKFLIQQILVFSRHTEIQIKPLSIIPIVKEVIKLLRHTLPATIHIQENIHVKNTLILADATQIHQILMNLCTNAGYAMHEHGGILTIDLSQIEIPCDNVSNDKPLAAGSYLELKVADTGHGIDPAIINKIFDPFFTSKKKGEGTGLGLSVVHGIVHSYGGHISAASQVGNGASFTIYFPVAQEHSIQSENDAKTSLIHGRERIMIVDDEDYLLKMMNLLLSRLGYQVTAKQKSSEALELFEHDPSALDMVITDQTMPDLTGFDMAKRMLNVRPDIPIILCTGFSDVVSAKETNAVGIRKYIMKPISITDLAQSIRAIFDNNQGETANN